MNFRDKIAEDIRKAREFLYRANVNDRLRLLRNGEYDSYEEAMEDLEFEPQEPTEADIDAVVARWQRYPDDFRRFVQKHRAKMDKHAAARWDVLAEEVEFRLSNPRGKEPYTLSLDSPFMRNRDVLIARRKAALEAAQ